VWAGWLHRWLAAQLVSSWTGGGGDIKQTTLSGGTDTNQTNDEDRAKQTSEHINNQALTP
jgi:hypothetical protein